MSEVVVREWTKLFGTPSSDYAKSISAAADGSVYVTGSAGGDLDGQTNSGAPDAFLSKYNSDGSKAWTQLLGTSTQDGGSSVSAAADGSVYITGYTEGDLDDQTNSGCHDIFVVKYSSMDNDRTFDDNPGNENNERSDDSSNTLWVYRGGSDIYSGSGGRDGLSLDFNRSQITLTKDLAGSYFVSTPNGTVALYDFSWIHFTDESLELEKAPHDRTFVDNPGNENNERGDDSSNTLWVYRGGNDIYSGSVGVDGVSVDFERSQTTLI